MISATASHLMPQLVAHDVSRVYTDRGTSLRALENVSLTLNARETLSIVGPSGCGKTTLMKILSGLDRPTTGNVSFGKSASAFVFQKPLLFPWRTILENVLVPAYLNGKRPSVTDRARATELLAALGLEGFANAYPSQMSSGMAMRTSLARALFTEPKLLFLDEPLSAVDELTRERLWIDFRRMWQARGIAVVLVTHSIREAVFLGDRVLVMSPRPGRIISEHQVHLQIPRDERIFETPAYTETCAAIRSALVDKLLQSDEPNNI